MSLLRRLSGCFAVLVVIGVLPVPMILADEGEPEHVWPGLRASGNQIIGVDGQPVRIAGVNRSGAEYACIQGWGFFDGPTDGPSVDAIESWGINTIRIPMNEQCWLGVNTDPAYAGANYQQAIADYVSIVTDRGLVAILDLHWSAPSSLPADRLQPMPDRELSVEFWRQVSARFQENPLVVFDLFNEPYPDNNRDTDEAWRCWRDGGWCGGVAFEAAGMQELVNAIRSTGAQNLILISGIQYGAGLSRWEEFQPADSASNLAASWHMYPFSWYASDRHYWDATVADLGGRVPLIAAEVGQTDCGADFFADIIEWLRDHDAGYVAWVWTAWGGCEPLITDYDGTPTHYGAVYQDLLSQER